MEHKRTYDIVWLLADGIGNTIQALFSVEIALSNGLSCGVVLRNLPSSFVDYLKESYGSLIIEDDIEVQAKHLIHCWLFKDKIKCSYDIYHYVNPDMQTTLIFSEAETYVSLVQGIIGSKQTFFHLSKLKRKKIITISNIGDKYIIYPGCSSLSPSKKWPYYNELINKIGKERCLIVGGIDDMNFKYSYRYPLVIGKLLPKFLTNRIELWKTMKFLGLLKPYGHFSFLKEPKGNVYINKFSWQELSYLFGNCKKFIGNDGGLSHFAGASGASGIVLFGPSSINKSRPFSNSLKSISRNHKCQPCFFSVNGIHMGKKYINCPYGIKCLSEISVEEVLVHLGINE